MHDRSLFAEAPHIVSRSDSYSLRWRYGSWGFYFSPRYTIVDGKLLFAQHATSSSGDLSGRYGECPIRTADAVRAIESADVYWVEPDGSTVQLTPATVRTEAEASASQVIEGDCAPDWLSRALCPLIRYPP